MILPELLAIALSMPSTGGVPPSRPTPQADAAREAVSALAAGSTGTMARVAAVPDAAVLRRPAPAADRATRPGAVQSAGTATQPGPARAGDFAPRAAEALPAAPAIPDAPAPAEHLAGALPAPAAPPHAPAPATPHDEAPALLDNRSPVASELPKVASVSTGPDPAEEDAGPEPATPDGQTSAPAAQAAADIAVMPVGEAYANFDLDGVSPAPARETLHAGAHLPESPTRQERGAARTEATTETAAKVPRPGPEHPSRHPPPMTPAAPAAVAIQPAGDARAPQTTAHAAAETVASPPTRTVATVDPQWPGAPSADPATMPVGESYASVARVALAGPVDAASDAARRAGAGWHVARSSDRAPVPWGPAPAQPGEADAKAVVEPPSIIERVIASNQRNAARVPAAAAADADPDGPAAARTLDVDLDALAAPPALDVDLDALAAARSLDVDLDALAVTPALDVDLDALAGSSPPDAASGGRAGGAARDSGLPRRPPAAPVDIDLGAFGAAAPVAATDHGEKVMLTLAAVLGDRPAEAGRPLEPSREVVVVSHAEKVLLTLESVVAAAPLPDVGGVAEFLEADPLGAAVADALRTADTMHAVDAVHAADAMHAADARTDATSAPAAANRKLPGADAPHAISKGEPAALGDGWAVVDAGRLDGVRGGFVAPGGLQISFGIERAVYINGDLVTTTSLNMSDLGRLTAGAAGGAARAPLALVQSGAGNVFVNGIAPAGLGTVIQNTLNDQKLQTITTINATVNSLEVLRGMNMESLVRDAVTDALRR